MASILIIDNYDSFTYNLVHYVNERNGHRVEVFRNDEIPLGDVSRFDGILLSPGPGIPSEAGLLLPIIDRYKATKRIFGVCLGLQAIAEVYGGELLNLSQVFHGVATTMHVKKPKHYLFSGIDDDFEAGRYHSWVVNPNRIPNGLTVTAVDDENQVMAMAHSQHDVCGVQFHPESILTPQGKQMVFNWLDRF